MTFDFRSRFAAAATYSDQRFATLVLKADSLAAKLTQAQREELIAGALRCGTDAAQKLRTCFTSALPSEMARLLQLRTVAGQCAPAARTRMVLSSYDPRPATITLNRELMAKAGQWLAEEKLLPPFGLEELAIAHELFHYLESTDAGIFSRQFKICLWRLGPLRSRSTVPATSEIAATACSRILCHLSFNPILLEPVILRLYSPENVEAWFQRLEQAD